MPTLSSFELTGRVTVVTGAGRGIGRRIALDVVQSGGKVAVGSRSLHELESLTQEIQALGGESFHHFLDVTAVDSIREFMAKTVAHFGRIDALVNNAGFNKQLPILDYDEALYDQILDANLKSVFFCSQTVAKQMIAQGGGGCIVSIASQAGLIGAPGRGPYSGAKAGVINLTRTMAVEWPKNRIRVNAVAPTVTRSAMAEQAMRDDQAFARITRIRRVTCVGRAERGYCSSESLPTPCVQRVPWAKLFLGISPGLTFNPCRSRK